MARKIGYSRVSTSDQNPALQIAALEKAGCDKIYCDEGVSGAQKGRPAFNKALRALKRGDTLIIWRLDRMSRSLMHLIEISQTLRQRGVYLESLTEKVDTSTPMGEFVFHILGAVAQLEREIIRERTVAGLSVAADMGRYPGRPRKVGKYRAMKAHSLITRGERDIQSVAALWQVAPITVQRALDRHGFGGARR